MDGIENYLDRMKKAMPAIKNRIGNELRKIFPRNYGGSRTMRNVKAGFIPVPSRLPEAARIAAALRLIAERATDKFYDRRTVINRLLSDRSNREGGSIPTSVANRAEQQVFKAQNDAAAMRGLRNKFWLDASEKFGRDNLMYDELQLLKWRDYDDILRYLDPDLINNPQNGRYSPYMTALMLNDAGILRRKINQMANAYARNMEQGNISDIDEYKALAQRLYDEKMNGITDIQSRLIDNDLDWNDLAEYTGGLEFLNGVPSLDEYSSSPKDECFDGGFSL